MLLLVENLHAINGMTMNIFFLSKLFTISNQTKDKYSGDTWRLQMALELFIYFNCLF